MTELNDRYCSICLIGTECLKNICDKDANNVQIISKLRCSVSDVDWLPDFSICSSCSAQLDAVCNFREMCVHAQETRMRSSGCDSADRKVGGTTCVDGESNHPDPTCEESFTAGGDTDCEDFSQEGDEASANTNGTTDVSIAPVMKNNSTKRTMRIKKFACPGCGKRYTTEIAVKRHGKVCKKMDMTSCGDGPAPNAGDDEGPPVAAPPEDGGPRREDECGVCGARFSNKHLVRRHQRCVHAEEKRWACALCPRRFASSAYLAAHQRYHRRDRTHVCASCGKGYITASDLYHHEKIHANRRAYRCDVCTKAFNTSSDLHKHRLCVHLDRSLWKYVCTQCQRRFPLKTNLEAHMRTHTGERRHPCHLCERRFASASALRRHVASHSDMPVHQCPACPRAYKHRRSLVLHLSAAHSLGDAPAPVKRFFCHVCPKSYFVNSKLQKHLRTHTGERPFKCPTCQKGFVDKPYLKQHMKVAHGVTDWQHP